MATRVATYLVVSAVVIASIVFSICEHDRSLLFSGVLAAFTGLLLFVTTQVRTLQTRMANIQDAFNEWTKKRILSKEDPELIVHGRPKFEPGSGPESMKLELRVGNPGDALISIEAAQIINAEIANPPAVRLKWYSEFPLLSHATNEVYHEHNGFPAPVFAGGLTRLVLGFQLRGTEEVRTASRLTAFSYTLGYRVGNSTATKVLDERFEQLQ